MGVALGINQSALRINPARTYEQEYDITYSGNMRFFVTFGENFLFGFNLKNRNDQEPANFNKNLYRNGCD